MWQTGIQRGCGLILLASALVAALPAKPEAGNDWINGVYAGKSPRVVALPARTAWQSANAMTVSEPHAFVVVGTGESMQPLYPPGTLLVLRLVSYAELQSGQTAVYRNEAQRAVAHVLVAKARDGWRVAGLNNPTHDQEPLLEDNLIGVVVAAYRPLPEPAIGLVAAR